MAAWVRSRRPSLARIRLTWVLTVCSATTRSLGDLGVGQAAGDQRQDLGLALGELVDPVAGRRRGRAEPGEARRSAAGSPTGTAARRRRPPPAPPRPASGAEASLSRKPLAPARSASYTYSSRSKVVSTSTLVAPARGRRPCPVAEDQAGGLQPVEHRHPDVHQDHVGPERGGLVDRVPAVDRLADDLDVGLGASSTEQPLPDHRLVVGDQHPDGHGRSSRAAAAGRRRTA